MDHGVGRQRLLECQTPGVECVESGGRLQKSFVFGETKNKLGEGWNSPKEMNMYQHRLHRSPIETS